jgi:dTDP-glucose 4,6-dehydratase
MDDRPMLNTILVTGGAGFIGSAVVRHLIQDTDYRVVNLDRLTYAGNLDSVADVADSPRYAFEQVDIRDRHDLDRVFRKHRPSGVMHLAAESHVDRSIDGPADFVRTNVLGTFTLLEEARRLLDGAARGRAGGVPLPARLDRRGLRLARRERPLRRGDAVPAELALLGEQGGQRPPGACLAPYLRLPVLTTNCSNNYGPYQFPEKLIPLMILNALEGTPEESFETGLRKTVQWYLENREWWSRVLDGSYRGERLGLALGAAS